MNGFEMLLKQAGIDVEKIVADFTTLKDGVLELLKKIDGRLTAIEARQDQIWQRMQENTQPPPTAPRPQLSLNPQPPPLPTRQEGPQNPPQ